MPVAQSQRGFAVNLPRNTRTDDLELINRSSNRQYDCQVEAVGSANQWRLLRVRHGSRVEVCKYCPTASSSQDIKEWIRQTFQIPNGRTFPLRGDDNIQVIIAPIGFENNEIFQLEINPATDRDRNSPSPQLTPKHRGRYYWKMLLSNIL